MPHLVHLGRRQLEPRRKLANLIAEVGKAGELVGGHEVAHAIGQLPRHVTGVIGKGQRRGARLPAAGQRRGQVPVEERDVGRDAVLLQLVEHALVVVEARRIRLAGALRKNARPRNRHAVRADAQILEQPHVFLVEVVGIVGHVARIAVVGLARRMREHVPDRRSAPALVHSAFNLVGGGGASPHEARRKLPAACGLLGKRRMGRKLRQRNPGQCRGRRRNFAKLPARDLFHGCNRPFEIKGRL